MVVGSLIGRNPGKITTQPELLADLLRGAGYATLETSPELQRVRRGLDIIKTLRRERRRYDIGIVTVYSGRAFINADAASGMLRLLGKRIILTYSGGDLPEHFSRHPRWSERVTARGRSHVCQSRFIARELEARGHRPIVIPNVLRGDYPHRERERLRPRLFWMRTVQNVYNPTMAIRVLALVREQYPEATLVLAGPDHGELSSCQRLARELKVQDAVEFPGFLNHAQKRAAFDAADIYLNTNHVDNRPLAAVEAAAMGLGIVATRVGGIPDLLEHEKTALLVEDDDHRAMAAAVCRLVEDRGLARTMCSSLKQLAEQSKPENVLQQWDEVIRELDS